MKWKLGAEQRFLSTSRPPKVLTGLHRSGGDGVEAEVGWQTTIPCHQSSEECYKKSGSKA
jgi:hypothetical protein